MDRFSIFTGPLSFYALLYGSYYCCCFFQCPCSEFFYYLLLSSPCNGVLLYGLRDMELDQQEKERSRC